MRLQRPFVAAPAVAAAIVPAEVFGTKRRAANRKAQEFRPGPAPDTPWKAAVDACGNDVEDENGRRKIEALRMVARTLSLGL